MTNIVVHKKMMIGFARYMAKCGYPIDEAPYGK